MLTQPSNPSPSVLVLSDRDQRSLIAAAQRVVHDRERAEDICQDVLLRYWSRPEAYDPQRGSLPAYLTVLCRSRAQDVLRSDLARRQREERGFRLRPPVPAPGPADLLADEQLAAALLNLRPAEAEAIDLAFLVGMTYTEVALHLGVPEGTVKSRIRRGLANLHNDLKTPGPTR